MFKKTNQYYETCPITHTEFTLKKQQNYDILFILNKDLHCLFGFFLLQSYFSPL